MAQVLVTGATGFVGRHVCRAMAGQGHAVTAVVRNPVADVSGSTRIVAIGNIGAKTDWNAALEGVDHVVHCAALAHQLGNIDARAGDYQNVNAFGTETLARACVRAGVRKFVLLSTLKVLCEETTDQPCTARSAPRPEGVYAKSKWHGEQLLKGVADETGLRYAIVRPPLIYGPGVGANFQRLMNWVRRGIPLPLAHIANQRSLLSVENLCDLICRIIDMDDARIEHPLLVSDGCDLSTPELVTLIAEAMHRRPRLFSVPSALLLGAARLCGKGEEASRLCGSLTVDISETRELIGWTPSVGVRDAIGHTVDWYMASGITKRS